MLVPRLGRLLPAFVTTAALLVTGVPSAAPSATAAPAEAARAGRPNVIVIVTDDMRADEARYLPAVRRLARRGVTFTDARSADPLCCPGRATLLTGKLAHNTRVIGNSADTYGGYQRFRDYNNVQNVLPQWLRSAGYKTAYIGKYMNEAEGSPSFTQPDWHYFAAPHAAVYSYRRNKFAIRDGKNITPVRKRQYRETFTRNLMLQRIKRWGPKKQPYFIMYNSTAPHSRPVGSHRWAPPIVEGKHQTQIAAIRSSLTAPPSTRERDLSDKPRWVRKNAQALGRQYLRGEESRRVASLLSVNDTVRQTEAALKRTGDLKNTVVMFTSDNGYLLGEHTLVFKSKPYDESLSVPLVAAGPRLRGGAKVSGEVNLADVTATIVEASGARHPRIDGRPLQVTRARSGKRRIQQRPTLFEGSTAQIFGRTKNPVDSEGRFFWGVRWRQYTLIRNATRTGEPEFYNGRTDPFQMENKHRAKPRPASPQARMQRWLRGHLDCRGSECLEPLPKRG